MNFLKQFIFNPVRDFIYPPVCLACNQYLNDGNGKVCSDCWNSFTQVHPEHQTWIELKSKFYSEGVVKDILSCYLFEKEGKLQDVIHYLKYQGMKSLGQDLGHEIGKRIISDQIYSKVNYLLPVPLHKLKQRERGYNQSEYICRGISDVTKIPHHTSLLIRNKYTQSQTQLNLNERKENVGDAFQINPKYKNEISGKSFILVDDVITTGATINSCARELLTAGANSVYAVSVALAQ